MKITISATSALMSGEKLSRIMAQSRTGMLVECGTLTRSRDDPRLIVLAPGATITARVQFTRKID